MTQNNRWPCIWMAYSSSVMVMNNFTLAALPSFLLEYISYYWEFSSWKNSCPWRSRGHGSLLIETTEEHNSAELSGSLLVISASSYCFMLDHTSSWQFVSFWHEVYFMHIHENYSSFCRDLIEILRQGKCKFWERTSRLFVGKSMRINLFCQYVESI